MGTLEDFYADERRRGSREVRFGSGWRSPRREGYEFVLFWVEATGELCLLGAPVRMVRSAGIFSRFFLNIPPYVKPARLDDADVSIEVLATLSEAEVTDALRDWEQHVTDPDGLDWALNAIAAHSSD